MTELYNPFTGETSDVSKGLMSGAKALGRGLSGKSFGGSTADLGVWRQGTQARSALQRGGRKVASGWRAATNEGDKTLDAIGIRSRTGAYTVGAGVGLAAGNSAGNRRAQRAQSFGKAAGYGGSGCPDSLKGTPMIGKTRQVSTPSLKGGFRATGLKLERFTGLSGDYSGMPENRGKKGAHKLGHYKKGRDQAAKEFTGKKKPVSKGFTQDDLDSLATQPGMINPGIQTSSWSHGMTPNQNFSRSQGARGRKIS